MDAKIEVTNYHGKTVTLRIFEGDVVLSLSPEDSTSILLDPSDVEKLRDALTQWLKVYLECPYTFSHTTHWCGYPGCRES